MSDQKDLAIFNFMCDVRDELEKAIPQAFVTVQASRHIAVEINVTWRMGVQKANIGQLVSIGEITERPNIAKYYVEKMCDMKEKAEKAK